MNDAISNLRVPDPAVACRLIDAIGAASQAMAECVPEIENAELRSDVARAVGTVVGMDMHDLLVVLLTQHPQLDKHGILNPVAGGVH